MLKLALSLALIRSLPQASTEPFGQPIGLRRLIDFARDLRERHLHTAWRRLALPRCYDPGAADFGSFAPRGPLTPLARRERPSWENRRWCGNRTRDSQIIGLVLCQLS